MLPQINASVFFLACAFITRVFKVIFMNHTLKRDSLEAKEVAQWLSIAVLAEKFPVLTLGAQNLQ